MLPVVKGPNDFTFKHSGQPDKYGQSLGGDYAQVQTNFDARAIDNQNQINAVITALENIIDGESGADWIGATPLSGGIANTVQGILEELKASQGTLDGQNVKLTGNQTVAGIKNFTSSPVVPTPVNATDASNKGYVDGLNSNQTSALNTHKSSNDHDGRYYTEEEVDVIAANFMMGAIPDNSLETKKIKNVAVPPFSLTFGTNTITKTGASEVPLNVTFTPKHYVNLLGKDGNCEDISKWTLETATSSLDTTKKVFGLNAIKITTTSTIGGIYKTINTGLPTYDPTKYYLISAYLDKGNATNIKLVKDNVGGGVLKSIATTATTQTRVSIKIQPSDYAVGNKLVVYVAGSIGQYGFVDGIQINEITATEYTNDSVDTLMARYPYADSLAVTINPSVKITHADGSVAQSVVEGEFLTGDLPNIVDNQVTGSKLWKKRVLFGKDYDCSLFSDYVGFKAFTLQGDSLKGKGTGYTQNQFISQDFEGKMLTSSNNTATVDYCLLYDVGANDGKFVFSVADAITGLAELIQPIADEVKAFMNGWKATANNGTRYTAWVSVVDGTTTPTVQSIDYVKINIAPNYEGYKLYYKLSTAQPINEGSDSYLAPLVGDVLMLESGANTVVFDTGVVKGEVVRPTIRRDGAYYSINAYDTFVGGGYTNSLLKYLPNSIANIYKNGVLDLNWTIGTGSIFWGNGISCYIPTTNFDPSATYTVDYTMLRTEAPQIGTAEASYSEGLVDSVNGLYGIVETKQNQDVSLDNYISLAMYEKTIPNSRLMSMWYVNGATLYVRSVIGVVKKLSKTPILNQDTLNIYKGNGVTDVTSLFVLDGRVYNDNQVIVTYRTTDATTITDIKANGVIVNGSITVDCRGVI